MRSDIGRRRGGFTAIELLIVLVVVLILIGMAVPALVGAMRKGSVNDAANSIVRISSQARQFARTRQAPKTGDPQAYFGLVLVADDPEQPAYVALTWGPTATKNDIFYQVNWDDDDDRTSYADYSSHVPTGIRKDSKGREIAVAKLLFNRNVVVYKGERHGPVDASIAPLTSSVGWQYQYRTGYPTMPPGTATSKPVNIGVDPDWPTPPGAGSGIVAADFPSALRHLTLRTADGRYNTAIAIYQIGLSNVQDY